MNRIASFVSHIFHPLLMPFYAVLIIFKLSTYLSFSIPDQLQRIILSVIFITTFLFPALFAMFLQQKGVIKSLEMQTISERKLPFLLTAACYLTCIFLLKVLPVPGLFTIIVIGGALIVLMAFLISLKWKISIHMMGIGGLTGLITGISEILYINIVFPVIVLLLLAGLIGTCRLIRNSHTQGQVYSGYIIGFFIQLSILGFYSH